MAGAGYVGSLFYKAGTPGTTFAGWAQVDDIKEASIDLTNTELDTSKHGSRWKTFEYGMGTGEISASGYLNLGDASQAAIEAAHRAGTKVYLGVSQDGTKGIFGRYVLTKFSRGAPVDGVVPVTISAKLDGAPTLVS